MTGAGTAVAAAGAGATGGDAIGGGGGAGSGATASRRTQKTPEQTEQRARTPAAGTLSGSTRNTV